MLRDCLSSALLCSVAMLLFYFLTITKNEKLGSFLTGDLLELYFPAIKSLANNLRSGAGLSYSWNLYMGMDAVEYYTSVAGFSLWNLLLLLFPHMNPETFVLILIVGKCGLAGAGFTYFGKRVLKVNSSVAVLFSIFYAMSGFQVVNNTVNIIWMDLVYLLPLILTFIVMFLEEKKWIAMVVAYAYAFLCNFYIAYILGIFSAIFFMLYLCLLVKPKEKSWKKNISHMLKYAFCVLLAAGLGAGALLPTAHFLVNNHAADAVQAGDNLIMKNPFLLLTRFLMGIRWSDFDTKPYLYCGILTILLVPFFLICKRIEIREKILYGTLFVLLLVSYMVLPVYIAWHGFDAPDQWYGRFTFCINFVVVAMACKAGQVLWKAEDQKNTKEFIPVLMGIPCWLVLLWYGSKCGNVMADKAGVVNVVILLLWPMYILAAMHFTKKRQELISILGIALALSEVICNGYFQHTLFQDRNEVKTFYDQNEALAMQLQRDDGWWRVNVENALTDNADTLGGYHGITDFSSFENYSLRKTMSKLGAFTSPRLLSDRGTNPFTEMLLGVKYDTRLATMEEYQGENPVIYRNPYSLSLGYLAAPEILSVELAEDNVFVNSNRVASALLGEEIAIFEPVAEEAVFVDGNGITLQKGEDGYYYLLREDVSPDQATFSYLVPADAGETYISFAGQRNVFDADSPIVYEYGKVADYGALDVTYSKKMDSMEEFNICTITMIRNWTRDWGKYGNAYIYSLKEEKLSQVHERLSEGQMEILGWENGYVHGKIYVEDPSKILFTSIPNVEGWKVQARRISAAGPAEAQWVTPKLAGVLENAFWGVQFPEKGDYEIFMEYEAPGFQAGTWISCISLCILISLGLMEKRYFAKKSVVREENAGTESR